VSFTYWTLLVAHIVSVVLAFGSLLSLPVITRMLASGLSHTHPGTAGFAGQLAQNNRMSQAWAVLVPQIRSTLSERALLLIGLFGIGLTVTHPDGTYWRQLWWRLAVAFYLVALVAILGVQRWALGVVARYAAAAGDALNMTSLPESHAGSGTPLPSLTKIEVAELRRAGLIAEFVSATSAVGLVVMVILMVVRPT
jgi:hypothetical protein